MLGLSKNCSKTTLPLAQWRAGEVRCRPGIASGLNRRRGRSRKSEALVGGRFGSGHAPRAERLKPGERVYMDGCGPLLPSLHTQLTDYIGCVDAGSGYAYLLPCVGQSEHNATTALAFFIAELRSLIGSQSFLSPLVVRTDGGSAFIALRFQEFCTRYQMHLTYSAPYEPNQNSFIERVWGSRFADGACLACV